jgi:hypothetical protein
MKLPPKQLVSGVAHHLVDQDASQVNRKFLTIVGDRRLYCSRRTMVLASCTQMSVA